MLALESPEWAHLTHAYGSAADLPALLRRAPMDFVPGHKEQSTWFSLWSALCHQDDVYTGSYAAVPHLVGIASARRGTAAQFDPLHLVACIELSRLEGHGPELPSSLHTAYVTAIQQGQALAEEALTRSWPDEYLQALRGCVAALAGRVEEARAIFDADLNDDMVEGDR